MSKVGKRASKTQVILAWIVIGIGLLWLFYSSDTGVNSQERIASAAPYALFWTFMFGFMLGTDEKWFSGEEHICPNCGWHIK
jgi:hypothetical protein